MWLRDDQFARIEALLLGKEGDPGRTAADNRLFVEAFLWIARSGSPYQTCDGNSGHGIASINGLADARVAGFGIMASVSTWVTTLISRTYASTGPSYAPDSPQTLPLLKDLSVGSLSTDKAYDTDAILKHLDANNIEGVIPPRSDRLVQRHFDKHLYKSRNLVERFFSCIKQFRRVAARYEKLTERFSVFVAHAAAIVWLA